MKTKLQLSGLLLVIVSFTNAQPLVQWKKCYGGSSMDYFNGIQQIADGGYVASGDGESSDGNLSGDIQHGSLEGWMVVLNSNGTIRHQKTHGGTGADQLPSVFQTFDGGYIAAGPSTSNDFDVHGNHGSNDYWIVKTDSLLDTLWTKSYGGTGDDWCYYVHQTADSGYIACGRSNSNNGNVTGNHGGFDLWIIKLTKNGNLQWQRSIGGSGTDDFGTSVIQTADGGFLLSGRTNSSNGDFASAGYHSGYDAALVKLDANGIFQWAKCYGGNGDEGARAVIKDPAGGYVFCGSTTSNNSSDVGNNHGQNDYWVVKTDMNGVLQWQRTCGGSKSDFALCIAPVNDGSFVVCGRSFSYDGEVTGNHPGLATAFDSADCWIVKLNPFNLIGPLDWEKCLGGSKYDGANWMQQTSDNGYIIGGEGYSNDFDFSTFHNPTTAEDGFVAKFGSLTGVIGEEKNNLLTVFPNPSDGNLFIGIPDAVYGKIKIELYDAVGELVFAEEKYISNDKIVLNLVFPAGVYFLKAKTGSFDFFSKVVIEK